MRRLFLLWALLPATAFANTGAVHIACNPPTERVDGSPFSPQDVNFYLVYLTAPDGTMREFRTDTCDVSLMLPYGTYSHRDVVCDKNLNCSDLSSVRKFTVSKPPKKPLYPSAKAI